MVDGQKHALNVMLSVGLCKLKIRVGDMLVGFFNLVEGFSCSFCTGVFLGCVHSACFLILITIFFIFFSTFDSTCGKCMFYI